MTDSRVTAADVEVSELGQRIRARCVECGDCWLWTGAVINGEVPAMRLPGSRKIHAVRRLILEARGIKPGPRCAIAKCDQKRCVRPAHAKAATRAEVQERCTRILAHQQRPSRNAKLSAHSRKRGKLTPEQVDEIRSTTTSQEELAKRWGVSQDTIWKARKRLTYRDYSGPMAAIARALA